MDLECAQSISGKNVDAEDLRRAFADDSGRGEFIILTANDGSFLQAAGEGDGPYVLEYRDEPSSMHYVAQGEFTKVEIEAAFLDYLAGDEQWRTKHTWRELETPPGCFGGLLLAATLAAASLLT